MGGCRLDDAPFVPSFLWNEREQYRENTAADGKSAPHQALPMRRNLGRIEGSCWRHVLFAPHRDRLVLKIIHLTPAREDQKRLVVWVAEEYPFQSVTVRVMKNRAQCVDAGLAKIFRAGQRPGALLRQFGQHAARVPFAVDAAGGSKNGEP